MQETRYAVVDGEKIPVLLSDENEALLAAKAAGRAIVGLWREDTQGNEWCAADTLIADVEDADEEFLGRSREGTLGCRGRSARRSGLRSGRSRKAIMRRSWRTMWMPTWIRWRR